MVAAHLQLVIVAEDFNQLDTTFLQCDHGLVQMVTVPTHCGNLINKAFVSRPDLHDCIVLQITLKSEN